MKVQHINHQMMVDGSFQPAGKQPQAPGNSSTRWTRDHFMLGSYQLQSPPTCLCPDPWVIATLLHEYSFLIGQTQTSPIFILCIHFGFSLTLIKFCDFILQSCDPIKLIKSVHRQFIHVQLSTIMTRSTLTTNQFNFAHSVYWMRKYILIWTCSWSDCITRVSSFTYWLGVDENDWNWDTETKWAKGIKWGPFIHLQTHPSP